MELLPVIADSVAMSVCVSPGSLPEFLVSTRCHEGPTAYPSRRTQFRVGFASVPDGVRVT